MILVLEGASGSGKTTLMRAIQKKLNIPVYRAFRLNPDDHRPGASEPELELLGVKVNSWMEDLYVSDFLSAVPNSVILDRSMPSALAYEMMDKGIGTPDFEKARGLLGCWSRRMKKADARIIHTFASPEVCKARSKRLSLEHIKKESWWIENFVSRSEQDGVPTLYVDTELENATDYALEWLDGQP